MRKKKHYIGLWSLERYWMLSLLMLTAGTMLCQAEKKNSVRLLLPPAVYAACGQEMNIYFENVILVPNVRNYIFQVKCEKGVHQQDSWTFLPNKKDVGAWPLVLMVMDGQNNILAQKETTVIVPPPDAGEGKKISLLMIGDSLTEGGVYTKELVRLMKLPGNPNLTLIGSHSERGGPPLKDLRYEGRGGWSWMVYCSRWNETKTDFRAKSPFLMKKNGKLQFAFQAYLDKWNNGEAPDYVTILLGTNDVFAAVEENSRETVDKVLSHMKRFLDELHAVCPKTVIGVALTPPPAASQDAFGANYKCLQTRWQFKRNQHLLVEKMLEILPTLEKNNVSIIPVYTNLDTVNNFPLRRCQVNSRNPKTVVKMSNGVHPANPVGYFQIADSIYSWLKFELNKGL